ncbi:MAG: BsaA family SipW-dependent biofilm matrix protein [Lachnospiraceae bacterium]|nr:BsaA family SipW-dependent biofilm matrix protein [Lachnospiraceae bacterium]
MKNKKILGIAAIAAIALIGSSFAYFSQTMEKENPFQTGKYDSTLVEKFNPADGDEWKPGAVVDKVVTVKNDGTEAMVVRVKFDEVWKTSTASNATVFKTISSIDKANEDPATCSSSNAIMNVWQKDPADGLVKEDDTVVEKTINTEDWILGEDGWYYYKEILKGERKDESNPETKLPGEETEPILTKVKLANDADMGMFAESKFYSILEADKTIAVDENDKPYERIAFSGSAEALAEKLKEDKILTGSRKLVTYTSKAPAEGTTGYSDASYTLIITSQTVQATKQAVNETFGDKVPTSGLNWSAATLPE